MRLASPEALWLHTNQKAVGIQYEGQVTGSCWDGMHNFPENDATCIVSTCMVTICVCYV